MYYYYNSYYFHYCNIIIYKANFLESHIMLVIISPT